MQGKLTQNQSARISLDLIAALAIFIIGLIYVATTMNTMFSPYQTETVDTQAVAYRASVMLVEDEGVKGESGEITRAGFAVSSLQPNILHYYKLYQLRSMSYDQLRDSLGLYRIINGKKVYYDCNILITTLDGNETVLQAGKPVPISGDVSSITREVYIISGQYATVNALVVPFPTSPAANTKVIIGVVGYQRMDVGIRLLKMQFADGNNGTFFGAKIGYFAKWDDMLDRSSNPGGPGGGNLICSETEDPPVEYSVWIRPPDQDEWIWKNGGGKTNPGIDLPNDGDMQLLFNKTLFQNNPDMFAEQFYLIELNFDKDLKTLEATPWLWNTRAAEGGIGNAKITIMVW